MKVLPGVSLSAVLAFAAACGGAEPVTPIVEPAVAGAAGSGMAGSPGAAGGGGAVAGSATAGGAGAGGTSAGGAAGAAFGGAATSPSGGAGGAGGGGSATGGQAGSTNAGFAPCPAIGSPCAIMPLGDSITEGFKSSAPGGGYRKPLFHLTLDDKKSITFVGSAPPNGPTMVDGVPFPQANEGVGGRTIGAISGLVVESMRNNKPRIVLLQIGTNDYTRGAPAMLAELGPLLDKITTTDPNALLVVSQLTPCKGDPEEAAIVAYNAGIPALVQARAAAGKHILGVDMHAAFLKNPNFKDELLYDKCHPRDAGYAVMADVWYAAIKPYLD